MQSCTAVGACDSPGFSAVYALHTAITIRMYLDGTGDKETIIQQQLLWLIHAFYEQGLHGLFQNVIATACSATIDRMR